MVSLFTLMVAAGVQVPAIDPRIEGHTDVAAVVDPSSEGPAAPAEVSTTVDGAPEGLPISSSTN